MAAKQLIYENAVPVSKARHANWSVEVGNDYAFSRKVNSVPLAAVEFPGAAAEYAIVFAGSAEAVTPVVILGVGAEVIGEGVDPLGEKRHLDPGRPGVVLAQAVLRHDTLLVVRHAVRVPVTSVCVNMRRLNIATT